MQREEEEMYQRVNIRPYLRQPSRFQCPWCTGSPEMWIDEEERKAQCRCDTCGARCREVSEETTGYKSIDKLCSVAVSYWLHRT